MRRWLPALLALAVAVGTGWWLAHRGPAPDAAEDVATDGVESPDVGAPRLGGTDVDVPVPNAEPPPQHGEDVPAVGDAAGEAREPPPAPSLTGIVVDTAGIPLSGASVGWRLVDDPYGDVPPPLTTDEDGRFELAGVPEGEVVELLVVREGFAPVAVRMGSPEGASEPVHVTLGEGAEVAGAVRDLRGDTVAGAEVFVVDRGAPTPLRDARWEPERAALRQTRAVTDGAGRYVVRGIAAPAEVVVYARAPDGAEGRSEPLAVPRPDGHHETDVVVSSLGSVAVTFVDVETGERVSPSDVRCSLDVTWTDARDDQKSRDDPEAGVARFRQVHAGRHEVHTDSRDFLTPRPSRLEVRPGEETEVEVDLDRGVSSTGRVVDAAGEPLDVHVTFEATWQDVWQYQVATTDERGRFTLRGLPPVAGELSAIDGEGVSTTWKGVRAGSDMGDLVFRVGAMLTGRLPEAFRGTSVECGLLAVSGGGSQTGVAVDEEGRFRVTGIDAGVPTNVYLRPEGRAALVWRNLVLEADEERDLGDVDFPEPLLLSGRVLDADGGAVPGALVRTAEWWCDDRDRTDAEGRFRLESLPPGVSTLWVEVEGGVSYHPFDVRPAMDPVTVRLPRPATLVVTLRREGGEPLANAPCNVFPRLDTGVPDWKRRKIARTDGRGVLEITLSPGFYGVLPHSASGVEVAGDEPRFVLTAGQRFELELRVR